MGSANLPPGTQDLPARDPIKLRDEDDHAELVALREENAQLRELVIHLSKLVIKNVVDQK
jgi:hypothetical protein